ncbi:unnamed protein product [Mytilus coruscus]|uniref:Reverse transcriptase domain-containing protein n=1 Tax=Mytilus coruscus TaxID=42192 RepID=A0A6J8A598_MYTCO|nr:unnamed protein product [Mytilus coruscus]
MQWDQIDKKSYNSIIQNSISSIENEKDVNIHVNGSNDYCSEKTIPTKLLQTKGPKWKASPEVLTILKACKEIYKKWQSVGKTKDHVLASELKNEKKKLRSKLRAEQALDRRKLYQQIIDNPNTQLFYRLMNRGRNNNRTTTNCLKINGEYMILPEEQRKGFAQYYEDLSIPKEEQYDCNYLNLCKIRQSCIQEALQECTPTCADDIAFISNNENELQIMLNVLSRYANEHHYTIHPMKTQIIDCSKTKSNYKWNLGGNEINTAESGVHLGIIRAEKNECQINIQERIQIARRTKYALMGSGVHGTNGLDPPTSYNIYKTYVVPRLIYGLEVLPMTKANIEQLEKFHRKNLRHIQSLPERTSNAAVLLLIEALKIETEIHKRCLSLLLSFVKLWK